MKMNSRARVATVGAVVAAVVIATALFWQDYWHGWPFSRHHDYGQPPVNAAASKPNLNDRSHENQAGDKGHDASTVVRTPLDIESARLEVLGVRFERTKLESMAQPLRAVATVVADEGRISHVHTRFSGWLERLHVNTTGQSVRAGQPLAAVFSQDLYASQNEYLTLLRQSQSGLSSSALAASRTRLELLGMTSAEIGQIERSGQARRLVTVVSPRNGVVLRRGVNVGSAIDPSTEIVTVADLSRVWVLAEIPEGQALGLMRGITAALSFPASGRAALSAPVDFIYPTLTERTRTTRVRFVVANPDGQLRPGLYGTAEFSTTRREALTIPRDAVVDTGESQHVFVRTPSGMLEPRTVKVGVRLAERVEITAGLAPDEEIVAAGVFLIDSESRLRASGSAGGHVGHGSSPAPASGDQSKGKTSQPAVHSNHGS